MNETRTDIEVPVWDTDTVESLRSLQEPGEPDLVGELVAMFLTDLDRRHALLREASARGDTGEASHVAHAIKGGALSIGAMRLARAAGSIESAGFAGDPVAVARHLAALGAERARFEAAAAGEGAPGSS